MFSSAYFSKLTMTEIKVDDHLGLMRLLPYYYHYTIFPSGIPWERPWTQKGGTEMLVAHHIVIM